MASWGHTADPYTIVEIEYDFQFETDPIHHPGKVALSFVLAKATLLAKPDITVKRRCSGRVLSASPLRHGSLPRMSMCRTTCAWE